MVRHRWPPSRQEPPTRRQEATGAEPTQSKDTETETRGIKSPPLTCYRFRHSHGGTGCGSAHKPFSPSRASFSNPSSTVSPGAYFRYHQHQPCFDEFLIEVHAIGQQHISKGAPVLVLAVRLERDFFPKDQL